MPIAKKRTPTSRVFSPAEVAAAKATAPARSAGGARVDWSTGIVTPGGGVAATVEAIRRAGGPEWQTRLNEALKEWLAAQPVKRKARGQGAT